ncbi:MAG: hypothetical protein HY205_03000 [Nitrospirae bacterium]|nr:hypothetical protein [Nitrospirota bacterium]
MSEPGQDDVLDREGDGGTRMSPVLTDYRGLGMQAVFARISAEGEYGIVLDHNVTTLVQSAHGRGQGFGANDPRT